MSLPLSDHPRRRDLLAGAGALAVALSPVRLLAQAPAGVFAPLDKVIADQAAKAGGSGFLAVAHQKRLVHIAGFGGMNPRDRYRTFSLSKAVTGLAVATLAQRGKLDLDAPLGRYIGDALKKAGTPADPRVAGITVRQTLFHMAGFPSNEQDDPIIPVKGWPVPKGHERDPRRWRKEDLLPAIIKRPLESEPGKEYHYSNAGYVILGLVIEAASGKSYEQYCQEAVFKPAGLDGPRVTPDRRFIDSVSGWQMAPTEILKLWWVFEEDDTRVLSPAMHKLFRTPSGAFISAQRTTYYSFGMMVRAFRPGVLIWYHTGRLQFGPKEEQIITFATRAPSISMVWAIRPSIDMQSLAAVDRDLWAAARAVKDWPAHDLFAQYSL